MAKEEKKNEIREGHPDAAHYALQPTSEELRPEMGEVPKDRFQEEVLKGNASGDAVDAHPVENQPPYGVTKEGQPDTTGRGK